MRVPTHVTKSDVRSQEDEAGFDWPRLMGQIPALQHVHVSRNTDTFLWLEIWL